MMNGNTNPFTKQSQAIAQQYGQMAAPYFNKAAPGAPPPIDAQKQNWLNNARQLNPSVDDKTLSDIYDQKVIPARMSGAIPEETSEQTQTRQAKESYQKIANDLVVPTDNQAQVALAGLKRGVKDLGQGIIEGSYQIRENDTTRKVVSALSNMPGLEPLKLLSVPVQAGTAAAYRSKVNKEILDYEQQTKDYPFTAGASRLAGSIITSLAMPELGASEAVLERTLASRMLSAGTTSAVLGGLDYDPTGDSRPYNAMMSSIFGSLMGATFHSFLTTYKWLKGSKGLIDDPAVLEASADRVKEAQSIGIDKLTAGAVSRNASIQEMEGQILKEGGPAADSFKNAQQEISDQIYNTGQKMIHDMGGTPVMDNIAGEQVLKDKGAQTQKAIDALHNNIGGAISDMYNTAGEASGWAAQVERADILDGYKDVMLDFTDPKFSKRVTDQLESMGELNKFNNYNNSFSVKDANMLVKALNKSYGTTKDESQKAAISILKSKIFDAFDKLSENTKNPSAILYNMARQIRAEMGNVYSDSDIVGTIRKMKGKFSDYIKPEEVAQKIFGTKTKISDLNDIERALTYVPPVKNWIKTAKDLNPKISTDKLQNIYETKILPQALAGREAWNNLRSAKFNDIINKSTIVKNGVHNLDYNRLLNQFKMMGLDGMKKLLGNDELTNKFNLLLKTMDSFNYKPKTTANLNNASSSLSRLVKSIFISLGAKDDGSDLRAVSFHIPFISSFGNVLHHIANENWVKSSLILGSQPETQLSLLMKKEPEIINNFMTRLAALKMAQPETSQSPMSVQQQGEQ